MARAADAAHAGSPERAAALVTHHAQPGVERPAACPYCASIDDLYVFEHLTIRRDIDATDVGVTLPEIDYAEELSEPLLLDIVAGTQRIAGVGCRKCSWSVQGTDALTRLAVL